MFNHRERKKMAHKLRGKHDLREIQKNYSIKKTEKRKRREEELLGSALNKEEYEQVMEADVPSVGHNTNIATQKKWYSLTVALPGSILNNAQSPELKAYLAGEIARSCAVFCVDEVVIFDETTRMTDSQINAYYSGSWSGEERICDQNNECNFHLARILEYLECPQYLRKALFPVQRPLKFAGILNPLDGMHHLRANDLDIPYREGVVLDKTVKKGHGSFCDVGLDKELQLEDGQILPPKTRITVKLTEIKRKRYRGKVVSPKNIRNESGIYWGYTVRLAKSVSDVFSQDYDVYIGTSERGVPIKDVEFERKEGCRILVVFGGLQGLETAVNSDEQIESANPADLFNFYINSLPDQGSRIIRTEEAIPITLAALKIKLD